MDASLNAEEGTDIVGGGGEEENKNDSLPLYNTVKAKNLDVTIEVDEEVLSSLPQAVTETVVISEVEDELQPVAQSHPTNAVQGEVQLESKKRFYAGDVVVVKEDRPLSEWQPFFGTVLKPAQGSEMAKNEDKGSSGEFHVHWDFTNRITMIKAFDVSLVDRALFRGQKVENVNGEIGIITDYETTVTVQISGSNDVVENVPLHRLRPISPHVRGQEVLLNNWVGVITGIKRNVWFKIDGGPLFYLEAFERDGFTRTDPFWGLGVACPGMRTRLASGVLKRAKWATTVSRFFSKWLPLHYFYSWAFSTIIRTEVIELEVKWLQPAPGVPSTESLPSPNEVVERGDLVKLLVIGTPSSETIGIGSVRKMKILPHDEISNYIFWLEGFKKKFVDELPPLKYPKIRAMHAPPPLQELVANNDQETPVRVLLRHNVVSVKWENGEVEKIPSIDIPKISTITDDGEFPAGLTVAHVQKNASAGDRYGIVMDSSELAKSRSRKVNVRWIIDGEIDEIREEPVFDIKPHPTYSMYHRGTILFPRKSDSSQFRSAVVIDVNIPAGKMVVIRSTDNLQDEFHPHQVIALAKRCHWSFFTRKWTVDDMIPPPYQLELEYDPAKRLVDVSEQRLDVLTEDPNNPQDGSKDTFPTLWDEPTFELLGFAPQSHRYYACSSSENFGKAFPQMVEKEIEFLRQKENVSEGIWIRSYENRMDLLSVLMVGPSKTPYEDGIFLFDIQLPADFPSSRPAVHYVSYTLEIHPLLSHDGNVCVSSVPWGFSEKMETPVSYIMLFLNKLQALLFTPTPYFASGLKRSEQNTENGRIKSELYNQGVFVRVLDSIWNMLQRPHEPWEKSIHNHFASALPDKLHSIEKWMNGDRSEGYYDYDEDYQTSPQLLIPDGLCIALKSRIEAFKKLFKQESLVEIHSVTDTTADSESHSVNQEETPVVIVTAASNRRLTPISELTEPSSTSTFGNKLSNLSVSSHDQEAGKKENPSGASLDSLKNVKPVLKSKGKEKVNSSEIDIMEVGSDAEAGQENQEVETVETVD